MSEPKPDYRPEMPDPPSTASIDIRNLRPDQLVPIVHYIQTQMAPDSWTIAPLSEGEAAELLRIDRLSFRNLVSQWLSAAVAQTPVPVELPGGDGKLAEALAIIGNKIAREANGLALSLDVQVDLDYRFYAGLELPYLDGCTIQSDGHNWIYDAIIDLSGLITEGSIPAGKDV